MTDTNDSDVLAIHDIRERTMHAENTGDVEVFDSVCADDVVVGLASAVRSPPVAPSRSELVLTCPGS